MDRIWNEMEEEVETKKPVTIYLTDCVGPAMLELEMRESQEDLFLVYTFHNKNVFGDKKPISIISQLKQKIFITDWHLF